MIALILVSTLLAAAPDAPAAELSPERAHELMPRADLSNLSPRQLAQFLEVAGDTFDYAGCNDTLARCLSASVNDKHALRMADLIKAMILMGVDSSAIIDAVERYYASFPQAKRVQLDDRDCPSKGDEKGAVSVVEFSDFQCPHCAKVQPEIGRLLSSRPVRLCAKYFPLTQIHPRAMIAAQCAEYARAHRKFWEMSELLFQNQDTLDDSTLKKIAKQIGLNGDDMLKEVNAGKFEAGVTKHMQEGTSAGVQATPSFFFNGRLLTLPPTANFMIFSAQDEAEWQANHGAWDKQ